MTRKILLLLALLLVFALPSPAQWPTIPIIQSNSNTLNATSINCAFDDANNVTSGNYGIVAISYFGTNNTPAVTDTLTSTYTQKLFNTSFNEKVAVYTTTFASSGANTVNVAVASGQFLNVACMTVPPLWSLTVDASAVSNYSGSPATVTTPAVTTTRNNDLILAYIGNDNSAGWQQLQSSQLGTWWQTASLGSADSQAAALRVGGAAGTGATAVFDSGGTQGTLVTLAFQSNALAITSATAAPDGATLNAYDFTVLAAGGVGSYTWSVISGALPTGLSINSSTGRITGTPSVSNNYSATIQVTDGTNTASKSLTFKIATSLNTISLVQSKAALVNTGAITLAFTSNVSAGDLIVLNENYQAIKSQVSSCTDSRGTPFKLISASQLSPLNGVNRVALGGVLILAGIAPSSGADTVSCPTGNLTHIAEFSNVNFVASDNTIANRGANASPATITSSTLTTLMPNSLIVGGCAAYTSSGTSAIDSPFTAIGTTLAIGFGYRIVTSATGYTMSCDQTGNANTAWLMGLAGFRPSGGSVTAPHARIRVTQSY